MSRAPEPRAGIVVTGTELLTGRVSDRNGPWIAERLGELGVEVAEILTVGDRPADLERALAFLAAEGVDLVVTSGGLGPTADDVTAEVVARFAGRELVLDSAMEDKIEEIVGRFARTMRFDPEARREANRKQATVPAGAAVLDPAGTAPGLVVPVDGGPIVIVLPGPPRELQAMWPEALATAEARAVLSRAKPFGERRLRLFGLPESEIAQSLREIGAETDLSGLEITTCLRRSELEVDVRHRPGQEDAAERVVAGIVERHGPLVYSVDGTSLDEQLAGLLQGRRVALAESITGGLLAARLVDRPGASDYVAGGVVAYSNEAKVDLLGVRAELIERHGAVSPEVAAAMASGARERFGADIACGVTGIAGPDGASERKPVGYVCFCVELADGTMVARDPVLPGGRADIRDRSVVVAMHMLRWALRGERLPL
jgi:nicotinamide-nucleotide amidase